MAKYLVAGLLAALWLAGCITDGSTVDPDEADGARAPGECRTDDDCAGGWCVGPPGCDVPWACVAEIPCSAAGPFLACGCDGAIYRASAGCPERPYGWRDPEQDGVVEGDACDPSVRGAVGAGG